ncbi:MAG: mechanosensitive ion channel family protein, partial [Actinomycetia bacterium]|nr:mechanosensitive ion channel family protein [Actinomycetes bacterium]
EERVGVVDLPTIDLTHTQINLIESLVVIVSLIIVRWLLLRAIHRYVPETEDWYQTRRVATYITTIIALISLAFIWLDAFDELSTYLGLVSAGIAISLSDLLKNMAGWLYIVVRRPLWLGDRIEVDGTRGDVVDVRLFRFTLMEIGEWVHADQSTGRLVHVPNGVLFTKPMANYTEGFEYIWNEIPVMVTFESNWEEAKAIVQEEIESVSVDVSAKASEGLRKTARDYQIKIGKLTPIVYLSLEESGVVLTGRFLVSARKRRGIEERVWEGVLRRFRDAEDIDLAYPTVRTFYRDPIDVRTESSDSGTEPTPQ